MTKESGNLPGTTAPQAQLARLRKRLTSLTAQLDKLSNKAESSKDGQLKTLLARAKANATTASSLGDAVDTIAGQTALDLLVATDNGVQVNVAVTAFEDVPDTNNLKPLASAITPVVLQDEEPAESTGCTGISSQRFSCCSPDPSKWFQDDKNDHQAEPNGTDTAGGDNTCADTSYMMLTMPVTISTSSERVDEFLRLGDSLVAAAQKQLGEARAALCHASGEDTCSLF